MINTWFGDFSLSDEAIKYLGLSGPYDYIKRNDPKLVECVERLGDRANGNYANLKIVEIPDDVDFYIHYYDGMEEVHEKHRVWR